MQTTIRKLGNSKGLIIPASFLASIGIDELVDIELKSDSIVITPVSKPLRKGWFDAYHADKEEDAWGDFQSLESEEDDWEW